MGATKSTSKEIQYDIIYVDIDDDITSVVAKIKNSKEEYIKLVPPKRQGFMQSSVTIKLIKRTAAKVKKHVAIVTTDKALLTLAATIGVFVAKNLQSDPIMLEKPELSDTASAKNIDDVIEGEDIDIDDYKDTSNIPEDKDIEVSLRKSRSKNNDDDNTSDRPTPPQKAPNFNKFRKRLLIFGSLGVVLIAFLVWAIVFAPHAKITILANTTSEKIQQTIQIGDKLSTDPTTSTIKSVIKTGEKDASVDGIATGERDEGTQAFGKATLTCNSANAGMPCTGLVSAVEINGLKYTLSPDSASIPGGGGTIQADIVAVQNGDKYNSGAATFNADQYGNVTGSVNSIAGGSSKVVKIVTDQDVKIAQEKFKQENQDDFKNDLTKELSGDYIIISQSFKTNTSDPAATPAVNAAASDGKFKLTIKTTYSLEAIAKSEIKSYLEKILDTKAKDMDQQKVYDYGVDAASLTNYMRVDDKNPATITLFATGKIGPNIDLEKIKKEVAGKKPMEITELLKRVNGITDVKVDLSPFWVNSVPNNTDKVEIQFESNN